jgi:carboxypeptidase C (cathepsin A)
MEMYGTLKMIKKGTMISSLIIMAAAVFLTFASPLRATTQEEPAIVTEHRIEADGKALEYTAETGRIAIRDVETGEPHGYMFYIAYRIPTSDKPRPVTFVWNGGPGANSSLLHFYVAGPKLFNGKRLVDNAETWLMETDLVFVDPIGCGFSRPTKAEYAAEFYGTVGDVASVTEFVRCWRLLHDADDRPVALAGESWGARRAASVGYALEKHGVRVNGLILISGGTGLNTEYCPPELKNALHVVDLSLTALYHGKTSPTLGKDPDTIRKKAEEWARETYAPALAKPDNLSDSERTAIIDQLSRFTGFPVEQIDCKTLSFTPRQYRIGLLKDQGKILQVFDMRQTVQAGQSTSVEEFKDKSAILHYIRRDLGYRTTLPYVSLEDWDQGYAPSGKYPENVNARWNWATVPVSPEELEAAMKEAAKSGSGPPRLGPPLPATEEAIALNPGMKVLVASGIFDSYASCAAYEETGRQLPPVLQQSISFKCYVGGHMMYLDPLTRIQFSKDVKTMIASIRRGSE